MFNGGRSGRQERQHNWSISGADAKRFQIVDISLMRRRTPVPPDATAARPGSAALRWATSDGTGPSFEDMDSADGDNVYLVTVTASDGVASKSQGVSITVKNTEEAGKITLTQLVPQEGIAITARLTDQTAT